MKGMKRGANTVRNTGVKGMAISMVEIAIEGSADAALFWETCLICEIKYT